MINLLINILFIFSTFLNTGASQCLDVKIAVTHMVSDGLKSPSDLNARTSTTQPVTVGDNDFLGKDSTVSTSLLLLSPTLSERREQCTQKNHQNIGLLDSTCKDILLPQQWCTPESVPLRVVSDEKLPNGRKNLSVKITTSSGRSDEPQVYYSLFHLTVLGEFYVVHYVLNVSSMPANLGEYLCHRSVDTHRSFQHRQLHLSCLQEDGLPLLNEPVFSALPGGEGFQRLTVTSLHPALERSNPMDKSHKDFIDTNMNDILGVIARMKQIVADMDANLDDETRYEVMCAGGYFVYGFKMSPTRGYYCEFMSAERKVTEGSYRFGSKSVILDHLDKREDIQIPEEHLNTICMDFPV